MNLEGKRLIDMWNMVMDNNLPMYERTMGLATLGLLGGAWAKQATYDANEKALKITVEFMAVALFIGAKFMHGEEIPDDACALISDGLEKFPDKEVNYD